MLRGWRCDRVSIYTADRISSRRMSDERPPTIAELAERLREAEDTIRALRAEDAAQGRIQHLNAVLELEAKAREHERRYQAIFDAMLEGLVIADLDRGEDGAVVDYRILAVNP